MLCEPAQMSVHWQQHCTATCGALITAACIINNNVLNPWTYTTKDNKNKNKNK